MVKSNSKDLVALSVLGEVTSAVWPATRQYRVGHTGQLAVLPGTGGICYSHVIGDNATTIIGDNVEPGVSIAHSNANCNAALNTPLPASGTSQESFQAMPKARKALLRANTAEWSMSCDGGFQH
jgi:hypothetical protein